MRRLLLLAALALALAACGADGPPEPIDETFRSDPDTTIGVTEAL